ncbi:MAG TPA: RNA polymerase sigma factor [Fimbriimonadaceae bacterium]|nr:RNA polymerase sigma factor [Fimbriimonadaceae bacterium]
MAPNHAIDLETARRIASGDAWATESFVVTHYAAVCRFMRHLTGHAEDSEDLTQQAFIKAKQQIASYRGKASLRTWLFRIALHEYTHWKRRRRRTHGLEAAPARIEPAYEACVEAIALFEALEKLPEALKETFLLAEVQEMSIEETAAVLGVPQGTVKSRLFAARKKLCFLLEGRQENEIEAKPVLES